MPHYIALIHKQTDSCYGVSFPDVPGVTTAGDTIDDAMQKAGEVLEFAAEDWPRPRRQGISEGPHHRTNCAATLDFQEAAVDASHCRRCRSAPRPMRRSEQWL